MSRQSMIKAISQRAWVILLAVLVVALTVGTLAHSTPPRTPEQRTAELASQIRCPTCAGLSVAQSQSPLAQSAKEEITSEVNAGRSNAQIKAFFVSRYGATALMSPDKQGFVWTAWVLPLAIAVAMIVGGVLAIKRWRRSGNADGPTDDQRRQVDLALSRMSSQ